MSDIITKTSSSLSYDEYSSIVKKLPPMYMLKLINTMIELYPDSVNVKRASDEYKYRQGLINTISSWEEEDLLS